MDGYMGYFLRPDRMHPISSYVPDATNVNKTMVFMELRAMLGGSTGSSRSLCNFAYNLFILLRYDDIMPSLSRLCL
eukprot:6196213-Pleurochrysis_carterae.AAC.2